MLCIGVIVVVLCLGAEVVPFCGITVVEFLGPTVVLCMGFVVVTGKGVAVEVGNSALNVGSLGRCVVVVVVECPPGNDITVISNPPSDETDFGAIVVSRLGFLVVVVKSKLSAASDVAKASSDGSSSPFNRVIFLEFGSFGSIAKLGVFVDRKVSAVDPTDSISASCSSSACSATLRRSSMSTVLA